MNNVGEWLLVIGYWLLKLEVNGYGLLRLVGNGPPPAPVHTCSPAFFCVGAKYVRRNAIFVKQKIIVI